ncbi:MAG: LLM class flavin-dependent oxidoreductase [Candidatus Hodarchaeota archaeon]
MIKFGVILHVTAPWANWKNFLKITHEAERLGYDSIWVTDHLLSPKGRSHGFEAWTILSALAAVTKKIRLGTYVICNQFRHPSLLAKMVSTIDHISNGRFELGIGAGWFKEEHISFGFNWDKISARINRLTESILLMKRLWTENTVSFNGVYYKTVNATLNPKPIQKPHPPIWMGGKSQAIKELVAKEGSGWIPVLLSPEEFSKGLIEIKKNMERIGRNFNQLNIALGGAAYTLLIDDKNLVQKHLKEISIYRDVPLDKLNYLIGDSSFCIEKINQYKNVGVKQIITGFLDFPALNSMKAFAHSIIPEFKSKITS